MKANGSDLRYRCKPLGSELNNRHSVALSATLSSMAIPPINQWVIAAARTAPDLLNKKGKINQAELARRLSQQIGRNIDRAAANKMLKGGRDVSADEMLALERITGYPVPSPNIVRKIPLIDWVSAGKLTEPRSQVQLENVPLIAIADLGRGDFFALTVQGTSMNRVSPEGSIIIVNRAEKELISGRYYVFSVRGDTTYKRWQGGQPPYLDPYSTEEGHKPTFIRRKNDLEVIGRVRRTMYDL